MHFHVALFVLLLTTHSFATPLHKNRHHPKHLDRTCPKFLNKRSSSPPKLDKNAALAAQAATLRKFQNAPSILAEQRTSAAHATYDRVSDLTSNTTTLASQLTSFADSPSNSSSSAVVPLIDETDYVNDYLYYGAMEFGSQMKTFQINFDTGSADLWVLADCNNCGTHTQYQRNASNTYSNTGLPFGVAYGAGEVHGTRVSDMVTIGQYTVSNQSFGAVNDISNNFATSPIDGIAGLAFPALSHTPGPTLFENLAQQLPAPIFSFYLTRDQVHGAEVLFGGVDMSKAHETTIRWVPVVSKTWWTVQMNGVSVNNASVIANVDAIIDTGTTFIYGPDAIVDAIYSQIPNSAAASGYNPGFWTYPCDTRIEVSFVLGPYTFTMDPRDMNAGPYDGDSTGSKCLGAIVGGGRTFFADLFILGDSFIKSYVVVFDTSNEARVGFLRSINE